jgi:hypothetical protein
MDCILGLAAATLAFAAWRGKLTLLVGAADSYSITPAQTSAPAQACAAM